MNGYDDSRPPRILRQLNDNSEETRNDLSVFEQHMRDRSLELAREFGVEDVDFSKHEIDTASIRKQVLKLSTHFQMNQAPVLKFELFTGLQLLAPPYDESWNVGAGFPFSAWEGDPIIFGGNGFSAAGFGIHLTCDRHVSVSVMPQGQFKAGWVNFDAPSPLRSSGGTGTAVYSDGVLVLSRQPRVWDVESPAQYASGQFDQAFASTASPALPGSLGTVPLGPVFFDMLPGSRYLIWFWIWQLNQMVDGKAFIVFSQANVPLILVNVGDPLILH